MNAGERRAACEGIAGVLDGLLDRLESDATASYFFWRNGWESRVEVVSGKLNVVSARQGQVESIESVAAVDAGNELRRVANRAQRAVPR